MRDGDYKVDEAITCGEHSIGMGEIIKSVIPELVSMKPATLRLIADEENTEFRKKVIKWLDDLEKGVTE